VAGDIKRRQAETVSNHESQSVVRILVDGPFSVATYKLKILSHFLWWAIIEAIDPTQISGLHVLMPGERATVPRRALFKVTENDDFPRFVPPVMSDSDRISLALQRTVLDGY
jgi:hypothetical protein